MSEVNFSVRLDEKRSEKINDYTRAKGISNKRWVETMIDRLRPAMDSICATPKRKSK